MISLMNHINSDRDNPLFALAFSSEGELYGYLETKTLDVLLMDENIPLDESKVPVACRMIFMTRDRVDGSEEISHNRIFKYSRVRNISSSKLFERGVNNTNSNADVAYEGVAVPSTPDTPETPDTPNPAKSATGDTMNVTLWVVVAIASCAAIPAVVVVCRRRTSR